MRARGASPLASERRPGATLARACVGGAGPARPPGASGPRSSRPSRSARVIAVLATEILDGGTALGDQPVVVDDQIAARGEARVQRFEPDPGRLVGVAVESDDRPAPIAEAGQRLAEEARDELDSLLEPEAREVTLHLLGRDGEEVDLAEVEVDVLGEGRRRRAPAGPGRSRPRRPYARRRPASRASRGPGSPRRRATFPPRSHRPRRHRRRPTRRTPAGRRAAPGRPSSNR